MSFERRPAEASAGSPFITSSSAGARAALGDGHAHGRGSYRDCVIAFGTMHGKHHQVARAFAGCLGAQVIAAAGIDTDQFGTFTGDIARTLAPLDAARAKARLAMTAADTPYGLASEASYGPLPGVGLPGHEEILLFLDDSRGIEIIEGERHLTAMPAPQRVRTLTDAAPLLEQINFGAQGVIVRPAESGETAGIVKGITDHTTLRAAIDRAAAASPDGHALLETDLRAHHNPTRRDVLTKLGDRLARRLATACPSCGSPGYGRDDSRRGLPCSACGHPTDLVTADIHSCATCRHQHAVPRPDTVADPQWCDHCNP